MKNFWISGQSGGVDTNGELQKAINPYGDKLDHPMDIYLSLGDTEERTKNAVLSTVSYCTRETYNILASENGVRDHVSLEWNQGGHFNNPTLRTAKGIAWLINKLYMEQA